MHGSLAPFEASLEHLADESGLRTTQIRELGRRISPISDLRAFAQLLRLVFREAPDVIHTHTAKAGTVGRLAAALFNLTRPRRRRCLVVHTFHGHVLHGYFGPATNLAVRLAERTLARITDRIVDHLAGASATTSSRASGLRRRRAPRSCRSGSRSSRWLDSTRDAPHLRQQLGIAEQALVVGYVGRFVPIKDLPTLIRAFAPRGAAASGRCACCSPVTVRFGPSSKRWIASARVAGARAPRRMDRGHRAAATRRWTSARCRR